jgi:pyruvate, water dikinase
MLPETRFPSPYHIQPPPGAEGWEKLYPYFLTFQPSMRERDEGKFWFCASQHWPNVFRPFETFTVEFSCKCLGQYNTRHLLVPSANGVDYRILNGYRYMGPVAVDPSQIEGRVPSVTALRKNMPSCSTTRRGLRSRANSGWRAKSIPM